MFILKITCDKTDGTNSFLKYISANFIAFQSLLQKKR